MAMITICSYQFKDEDFHQILKPQILRYLRARGVVFRVVGSNPDITCKAGKIVLEGQTKRGGKVSTDILFTDVLSDLGYLQDNDRMVAASGQTAFVTVAHNRLAMPLAVKSFAAMDLTTAAAAAPDADRPAADTLNNLIDRLWDMTTGAGQAGSALASPVITSLHMCYPGIPIRPKDFDDMRSDLNPTGDLRPTEAFSHWVDRIPDVTSMIYRPTIATVSEAFSLIVNSANSAAPLPTQTQMDLYNQARSYLFTKAINPFTGAADDQETPTPVYQDYLDAKAKYERSLAAQVANAASYDVSKSEEQRKYTASAMVFQNATADAYQHWNAKNRTYVDQALDILGSSLGNMAAIAINQAKAVFTATEQPALDGVSRIHYSYSFPNGWWKEDGSFTQLSVKSNYSYLKTESHTKKASAKASLFGDLWSVGGSGGFSRAEDKSESTSKNLSISLEMATVDIIRPWLATGFMKARQWYIGGEEAESVSTGDVATQTNDKLLPLIPVQMIVARNISLVADWSEQDKSHIQQNINASASVGYGPFSLNGSYEQGDTTDRSTSSFDGTTLNMPGLQVIGFVCSVPPRGSPMADPNIH